MKTRNYYLLGALGLLVLMMYLFTSQNRVIDQQEHIKDATADREFVLANKSVVLLENVGEVRRAHRVAGHGHHGLGGGPGQGETQEEKQTRQAGQDRGGGAVVAHRGELTAEFSASPSILTFSCAEESHRT